jgi:RimJ/RimL family protein N-acetyltransferase
MSKGLLFSADAYVCKWVCDYYGWKRFMQYDNCIGVLSNDKQLVGAIFLHGYNGNDLHLSYYGQNTLTPGIARTLGQFIISQFDPARLTVIVSKRNKRLIRSCQRFGFKLEGAQRCYYGKLDCNRNTGVRMVMFRDKMDRVANISMLEKVA